MSSEIRQTLFTVSDNNSFQISTETNLVGYERRFWSDGKPKSDYVLNLEKKFPGCFTREGEVFGINPEGRYMKIREIVGEFFKPYITPRELDLYWCLTQNYEVCLHTASLNKHKDDDYKRVNAYAATSTASWNGIDQKGVVIILNYKKIQKDILTREPVLRSLVYDIAREESEYQGREEDFILYRLISEVVDAPLAHELIHHMLRAVRRDLPGFSDDLFEKIIEECAQATIGLGKLDPEKIQDFIDEVRLFTLFRKR